jgi:hypothetical protein
VHVENGAKTRSVAAATSSSTRPAARPSSTRKKTTSTLAKLERYAHFFTGFASSLLREDDTWYARSFKDASPAEVLFVTQSEARRDSIAKLIGGFEVGRVAARAMTVAEAHRNLRRALYRSADVATSASRAVEVEPAAPSRPRPPRGSPALSAGEERLRRGRVAVRGEQLANFERALRATLAALASAQKALALYLVSPGSIPKQPPGAAESLLVLGEYARRGREALSLHKLSAAD